jgi:hypothetical protein
MNDEVRNMAILQVARQVGLTVTPDDLARVAVMFGVLERAAAQLFDEELPADTVAAAVFEVQGPRQ